MSLPWPPVIRRPTALLAPFVTSIAYHRATGPPIRERRVPSGDMQLVVNLAEPELRWYDGATLAAEHRIGGGAALTGAVGVPIGLDTRDQAKLVMVGFRFGGTLPFFALPAGELTDPLIDLAHLWGAAGASLRERLLEMPTPQARLDVLHDLLADRLTDSPAHRASQAAWLRGAADLLDRGLRVTDAADRLGTTSRTLTRHFTAGVGLAPKRFARIRRMQRLLATKVARGSWAEAAVANGYVDQAHLIHEFHALTGIAPGAYRPRFGGHNHIPA